MFSSYRKHQGATMARSDGELIVSVDSDVLVDPPLRQAAPAALSGDGCEETDHCPVDTAGDQTAAEPSGSETRRGRWKGIVACWLLPGLALLLAIGTGYLKWQDGSARASQFAATQSVSAASETTVALLSYRAGTVDKDLDGARDRLTGSFRDAYTQLVHDVVIPGAKQKQISAAATVPAAAPVTATANHAVVIVFVDQTITVGNDAPTNSISSVKVTLDKVHERWLVSGFDPV